MYLCLNCFSYNNISYMASNKHHKWCINCNSNDIIEVDDLIAPVVKELNQKGYKTLHCCSGHINQNGSNTYISFSSKTPILKIPKYFVLEDEEYYRNQGWDKYYNPESYCIRRWYGEEQHDMELLHKEIINVNLQLLEWAKELPNLKGE